MDVNNINNSKNTEVSASYYPVAQVTQAKPENQSSPVKAQETGKGQAVSEAVKELNKKDLDSLSEAMNNFMEDLNADLRFAVHEKTKQLMVQIYDIKQQKVIKEYPSHEFLDTIARIREYVGALLDKKA